MAGIAHFLPQLRELLDPACPHVYYPTAGDGIAGDGIVNEVALGDIMGDAAAQATPHPDTTLVIATSGTTGTPKLAQLGPRQLRASATATHKALGGEGAWLLCLPPHHIAGLQVILRSLAAGHTPTVQDTRGGFQPAEFAAKTQELLAATPDTRHYTSLVPTQLHKLLTETEAADSIVHALRSYDAILLGGAALSPQLHARACELGITIVTTYGSSETAGGCVYDGYPLPGALVEIDEDGRIWLGGDTIAYGYLGQPDHPAWDYPGWFRTDDHGHWEDTPRGKRLHVDGRLDDAIQSGGLTIFPRVVEAALSNHPEIAEVAVLGLPDERLGEKVCAIIVPALPTAPDTSDAPATPRAHPATPSPSLTVTALAHWLTSQGFDKTAAPREVRYRDTLPTRGIGKIDYRTLRQELQ